MNRALAAHGAGPRPEAELVAMIGPPTRLAFGTLMGLAPDAPEVEACVADYRADYAVALRETTTFPGVPAALDALAAHVRLAIATSKPARYAEPVLEAIGLRGRFEVVAGPEPHGMAGKAETIAEAIAALGPGTRVVAMVGDRRHDVEGAHAHGLLAVGVLWGFGDRAELEAAEADVLVAEPAGLVGPLLSAAGATVGAETPRPGGPRRSIRSLQAGKG